MKKLKLMFNLVSLNIDCIINIFMLNYYKGIKNYSFFNYRNVCLCGVRRKYVCYSERKVKFFRN